MNTIKPYVLLGSSYDNNVNLVWIYTSQQYEEKYLLIGLTESMEYGFGGSG